MGHNEKKLIPGFENYYITIDGDVVNATTGRIMTLSPTMHGDLTVGLVRDEIVDGNPTRVQHRRSVKGLVARAFVFGESNVFDTPILLDHDERNLHASNIQWRPRWFAWKYYRQFDNGQDWFHVGPIYDVINNIEYGTMYEAVIANGILVEEVKLSLMNGSQVFPTAQIFEYI